MTAFVAYLTALALVGLTLAILRGCVPLCAAGKAPPLRWLLREGRENATQAVRNLTATRAEHLAKVPTAFRKSPLSRDLMMATAADLAAQKFPLSSVSG